MMFSSAAIQLSKSCTHALIMVLIWGVSAARAQDAQAPTFLDDLEFKIEIGWHERLIKRRTAEGATLAPFRTDGCSGGLSTGWSFISATLPALARRHGDRPPWENCCVAHDRTYHTGGATEADAKASFAARRAADEELRLCVMRSGEDRLEALSADYGLSREEVSRLYRTIADVMYRAVRLGGVPCSGMPWRWGFGWPQCD
jgi:hypothetical protein